MKTLYENKNLSLVSTLRDNRKINKEFKKIPLEGIKKDILGKDYDLSLVIVGRKKSRVLNKKFRGKDSPTDVLSFELTKKSGEIFICPEILKIKSKKFLPKYQNYLLYIVIHAILHLKGYNHGDKMERFENIYYKKFIF